jgi:hypothetical protein
LLRGTALSVVRCSRLELDPVEHGNVLLLLLRLCLLWKRVFMVERTLLRRMSLLWLLLLLLNNGTGIRASIHSSGRLGT